MSGTALSTDYPEYGGTEFSGFCLRIVVDRPQGMIECIILGLHSNPFAFYTAIVKQGSLGPARIIDEYRFEGLSKLEPVVVYSRRLAPPVGND